MRLVRPPFTDERRIGSGQDLPVLQVMIDGLVVTLAANTSLGANAVEAAWEVLTPQHAQPIMLSSESHTLLGVTSTRRRTMLLGTMETVFFFSTCDMKWKGLTQHALPNSCLRLRGGS